MCVQSSVFSDRFVLGRCWTPGRQYIHICVISHSQPKYQQVLGKKPQNSRWNPHRCTGKACETVTRAQDWSRNPGGVRWGPSNNALESKFLPAFMLNVHAGKPECFLARDKKNLLFHYLGFRRPSGRGLGALPSHAQTQTNKQTQSEVLPWWLFGFPLMTFLPTYLFISAWRHSGDECFSAQQMI